MLHLWNKNDQEYIEKLPHFYTPLSVMVITDAKEYLSWSISLIVVFSARIFEYSTDRQLINFLILSNERGQISRVLRNIEYDSFDVLHYTP